MSLLYVVSGNVWRDCTDAPRVLACLHMLYVAKSHKLAQMKISFFLTLSILVATSADNLCKQFDPRSGPTECRS